VSANGTTKLGMALLLAAGVGLGACARGDNAARNDSAAAGGDVTRGDSMTAGDTAGANAATAGGASGASTANMSDAQIASWVATADQGEVDAGKVAQTKATNRQVRRFATHMVTDHTKLMQADARVARAVNAGGGSVTATTSGTASDANAAGNTANTANAAGGGDTSPALQDLKQNLQSDMSTLQSTGKGADFDRAYIAAQVKDHEVVLQHLQQFESQARNAQLKQGIQAAIPKVRQHLQEAQRIMGTLDTNNQPSTAGGASGTTAAGDTSRP
jgi:putative membrane protein